MLSPDEINLTLIENDEQKKILLKQFKEAVRDCESLVFDFRDEYLVKWLIARNFSLELAEKMLRQSIDWRRNNNINEIVNTWTPPEVLTKYFSFGRCGKDKFGCPLFLSAQGKTDIKGILQSVTKRDYMRYQLWMTEKINGEMREESKRTGKVNTYITFISDAQDLSIKQMAYKPVMDAGMEQTKVYDANYPENLRRIFVINAPKLFTVIWNVMKPLLNKATVDKVMIFGSDPIETEKWKAALLDEIEADQLPVIYGGTMTDPEGDPRCLHMWNMGGEVPREYYMSNTPPVPKEGMETLTLIAGAGGFKRLKFKVDLVGSALRWEFITEGGDLRYRIFYKSYEGVIEDLVPLDRVESHLVMEDGVIICELPGKYFFEFDNTFSLVRTKKIRYSIYIEPPAPTPVK